MSDTRPSAGQHHTARRGRRILLLAAAAVVAGIVVLSALIAGLALWPAPTHAPTISCSRHLPYPCVRAAGRVVLHTRFAAGRRAHVLIASRASTTLPGLTSAEFPVLERTPPGLDIGRWIVLIGYRAKGSHDEQDLHVTGFATGGRITRCNWIGHRGLTCAGHGS